MLATAAKLSRALAATFDVLLSELALEVQLEALLQVTHHPLPASAESAANGFWQIVSIKEQTTYPGLKAPTMSEPFCFQTFFRSLRKLSPNFPP